MYVAYRLVGLVCALIVVFKNIVQSQARASGIYVDNGRNQTVLQVELTEHELKLLKQCMLQFFGIKSPPRRSRSATIGDLKNSNSMFLIDVYKKYVNKENARITRSISLFQLNEEEEDAIDHSDTIIALANHNDKVSNVRHERGNRLWFNVSDVAKSSDVIGAEVRFYKRGVSKNVTYTISLYKLINIENGERDLELIESLNVLGDFMGWIEMDMINPLKKWVDFRDSNKGLYLSVSELNKPGHEIKPEDIGLITASVDDVNQPFMVVFVRTKLEINMKIRTKRETSVEQTTYDPRELFHNPYETEEDIETSRSCRLRSLYIDFKDLNWQDWIIAPEGYNAYYCSGECNFPLNAYLNATNHAIIQTLAHLVHPELFPKPSCVPTKYLPISVLYFLEDSSVSNVALKRYKKMIAKSCGCH